MSKVTQERKRQFKSACRLEMVIRSFRYGNRTTGPELSPRRSEIRRGVHRYVTEIGNLFQPYVMTVFVDVRQEEEDAGNARNKMLAYTVVVSKGSRICLT